MGVYKITVVYHFKVMGPGIGGTEGYDPYMQKQNCPKGIEWKISLNPNDSNSPIYSFEIPSQLSGTYVGLSNINLHFVDPHNSALGQAADTNITLDDNAV